MASIVVRNVDPEVKEFLVARAAEHGRSMEAEVRDVLARAARRPRHRNIALALRGAAESAGVIEDLPIPERVDDARLAEFE
ncbi:FitA-like ribbon-helix-helix domain-containing protein [Brachybacterium fresconis]|uniref:Plasmid stability protein n=1 Tax=Brachybacterium fresconis TaxID=173363 RepID=A0ABS4YMV7_9MICO|nr:toxin-antitoxin system [Brachybacterium fresconis]MBP2410131.1 plasmid stability protein [Brachybacterium fresconis]